MCSGPRLALGVSEPWPQPVPLSLSPMETTAPFGAGAFPLPLVRWHREPQRSWELSQAAGSRCQGFPWLLLAFGELGIVYSPCGDEEPTGSFSLTLGGGRVEGPHQETVHSADCLGGEEGSWVTCREVGEALGWGRGLCSGR